MKNALETISTNASFSSLKKILFFDFRKIVRTLTKWVKKSIPLCELCLNMLLLVLNVL